MKSALLLFVCFFMSGIAQADFKEDFLKYAAAGKLEELDVLIYDRLESGGVVDFNVRDAEGSTPLMLAAWNSRSEIVKFLMQFRSRGLDVNLENSFNDTALTLAVYKHCVECAKILMNNQAAINDIGKKKKSAIHVLFYRHVYSDERKEIEDFAIYLVNNGADLLARDDNGQNMLHIASRFELQELATLLIERGVRINTKNIRGATPLMLAAGEGNNYLVDLYLKNNAYKTLYDNEGDGPLHYAVMYGHFETTKLLLQNDFDVSVSNKKDRDVFDIAARGNKLEIFDYLNNSYPNHYVRAETLNLVKAVKRYDQLLQSFISLTSKATSQTPIPEAKPGSSLGHDYYKLSFPREYFCASRDRDMSFSYVMDFSKNSMNLYLDTRDVSVNQKMEYQVHISSSIDDYFPGLRSLVLAFTQSSDRKLWFDTKYELELLASEIQKYVPLTSTSQTGISSCN